MIGLVSLIEEIPESSLSVSQLLVKERLHEDKWPSTSQQESSPYC